MAKKHIKGIEVKGVVGEMEKESFIVKGGVKVKDQQVKPLTQEDIDRANKNVEHTREER